MNKLSKKIAITTGDVNGIGAEITIKALNHLNLPKENVILISNHEVLKFYGASSPRPLRERSYITTWNGYKLIEVDFDKKNILPGKITAESGEFSFQSLKTACEMAKKGEIDAIVTAPVSKEALHLAGHKFSGQTEILQEFLALDGQKAEMLFAAGNFRVLLLTRHLPLKEVLLDKSTIVEKIITLDKFFKDKLKICAPKFALCAFNPHAGEGGILGREEIEIMQPAVNELREKGIDITNPMPADTLFINAAKAYLKQKDRGEEAKKYTIAEESENNYASTHPRIFSSSSRPFTIHQYDCYIACYHDQGLIPIKTIAAGKTVNMTIGLDVIRTSPSHGTAFDIAGKNLADETSMIEAIKIYQDL